MEVTMNRNPLLCVVAVLATCGLSAQALAGGPARGVGVDAAAYTGAAGDLAVPNLDSALNSLREQLRKEADSMTNSGMSDADRLKLQAVMDQQMSELGVLSDIDEKARNASERINKFIQSQ
jgi:hypothetical protein